MGKSDVIRMGNLRMAETSQDNFAIAPISKLIAIEFYW